MTYAQINEEKICFATATSNKVKADLPENWILINDNEDVLGKRYTDGIWEAAPQEETETQPTNADILRAVEKSRQDIIDEYTLELINEGVI